MKAQLIKSVVVLLVVVFTSIIVASCGSNTNRTDGDDYWIDGDVDNNFGSESDGDNDSPYSSDGDTDEDSFYSSCTTQCNGFNCY